MALEAGSAMHEVFSAVRIWQLQHRMQLPDHALVTAHRLFGKPRWRDCVKRCTASDDRENLMELAFAVLHTGDWQNDPKDQVRTMQNMELASIHYIDDRLPHLENWPIYVEDFADAASMIGIEQHFDVVLTFGDGKDVRYIGTIDGLVMKLAGRDSSPLPMLDENKTANRLSNAWQLSFDTSHQVTGYLAVCPSVFGFPVNRARVLGVKIPPTNKGEDVIPYEPVPRDDAAFESWGRWVRWAVDTFEQYENDFENAQRFTHSCSRYFRPCALLPFCADTAQGRKEQWEQMVPATPSPSERAVMEV